MATVDASPVPLYGEEMRNRMFTQDVHAQVMNCLLGLAGESGEICDLFKKANYHPGKSLNLADLRAEIGDVLWYLATLNYLYFQDSLLDVARENVAKLTERYPDRYGSLNVESLRL